MRSSFWRVALGVLIALAAPIVIVLVLAVLILSVPPVGRYALSQALVHAAPRVGLRVTFGRVEGNIMRSIAIDDVTVRIGPDSLQAKQVTLTYDPWSSIRNRNFAASAASAVEPRLYISSQRPASAERAAGRTRYPSIRIGQFRLSDGSVCLDTVERLDSVNLILNLVSTPDQVLAELSDVRAHLRRENVSLANLRGSARLTPDSLIVTGLTARTAASSLRAGLKMEFQPTRIAVRLESLSVSLPEFTPFKGRIRAVGDVGLDQGQPSGGIKYAADGLVWQAIHLPTLSGNLGLKDSVVQVTMSGQDTTLGSAYVAGRLDLRKLDFSGSVRLAGVRMRLIDSVLPAAAVDADIEAAGRGFDSVAASLTATAPDLDVEQLTLSGFYLREGQRVAVEQLDISGPIGVVSAHGVWQKNRVRADVRMDGLDLGRLAKLESLPVRGRFSGNVSLAGSAETLDATGQLSVSDLQVADLNAASARADFAVAAGRRLSGQIVAAVDRATYGATAVDSVRLTWNEQRFGLGLWRPDVSLAADGDARLARDSIGVDVASLRIKMSKEDLTFDEVFRLGLGRDSLNILLAATGLAGGDVRAALAQATGKPPRIEATVNDLDLAKLKALLGLDLDMSGTASIRISGTDSFDVTLDAERLSMPDYDVALSRAHGQARVSPTRADFDHLWLVRQDSNAVPETSVVSGWFEYSTQGGFRLGAADLRARLRNPGAWVVFYLKSILELQQGSIYGDVAVRGTLMQPQFDGRVRISRARIGVPVIGTSFDRVGAELVFDRSRINIEKLTGRSEHGNALVTGFVDIGQMWQVDSLRFHGDFSGTTINPMPEIYGTIGGSLDLNWSLGMPFALTGTVNVQEALIAFGFGQSAGGGTGAPDTTLIYDVRVKGDRNIWFRNQLADIELGCDLTVRKTTRDMLYSGELTSRQGSIYYLDHTLRVDSGSVRFDNISTLNPEFYVTAGMPIRTAASNQTMPETIAVTLTGTLEKPSFAFRSVPPIWDETEILYYLTLNATPDQLQAMDQKNKVSALLSERLLGYFQTQVSKRARGFVNLDYLEFESGLFDTSKQARVTVGKYVGRNLYVSYTQSLSSLAPAFRVEYYINRKNEILTEGNVDDRYGYRTSLRYQFRLRY